MYSKKIIIKQQQEKLTKRMPATLASLTDICLH